MATEKNIRNIPAFVLLRTDSMFPSQSQTKNRMKAKMQRTGTLNAELDGGLIKSMKTPVSFSIHSARLAGLKGFYEKRKNIRSQK